MYTDDETLDQYRTVWLTKEVRQLVNQEKRRLKKEENREVSIAKLVNNALLEKYGNARLRSEKGMETANQPE